MRIRKLSSWLPHRQDGAIAVLMAVLLVVLVGLTAFSVDFGLAYDSKRQLQNASDAAALTAAAVYAEYPGDCATLAANSVAEAEALAAGQQVMDENRSDADHANEGGFVPDCTTYPGQLAVTWESSGATDVIFGGVTGAAGNEIVTSRSATAILGVPSSVSSGLRPIALCSDSIPATLPATTVEKVEYTGHTNFTGPCPGVKNSGNWWSVKCPDDDPNTLKSAVRFGCTNDVSVVDGAADESDPVLLRELLMLACPGTNMGDEDCLAAKTGKFPEVANPPPPSPLASLFGKEFLMPVFCAGPPIPCAPEAAVSGDIEGNSAGANVEYPVYQIAGVKLCGYHWGNRHAEATTDPDCDTDSFDSSIGTNDDFHLFLLFTNVRTSGTVVPGGGCGLAEDCDAGARAVALVR